MLTDENFRLYFRLRKSHVMFSWYNRSRKVVDGGINTDNVALTVIGIRSTGHVLSIKIRRFIHS